MAESTHSQRNARSGEPAGMGTWMKHGAAGPPGETGRHPKMKSSHRSRKPYS